MVSYQLHDLARARSNDRTEGRVSALELHNPSAVQYSSVSTLR